MKKEPTILEFNTIKKRLIKILRWLVPVVILYIIFQYIDFNKLLHGLKNTNIGFMAIGLAHFPLLIFIAIFRWRALLLQYHKQSIPMRFVSKHYWIGLAFGFFTPGSMGLDAYRIVASGRQYGHYINKTIIILVEKLLALTTCMAIIVCLYPLLPIKIDSKLEQIVYLAYTLLLLSLGIVGLLILFTRIRSHSNLVNKLDAMFSELVSRILRKIKVQNPSGMAIPSFTIILEPFSVPHRLILIVALSFGIQFFSAVKSQIFFYALGYDLPFIVNLFVAPTLYFIFILPISFGSLGIREGAYIILYGLFGVPPEIALLVSFFNLSGMLFNNLIGGVVMLLSKETKV